MTMQAQTRRHPRGHRCCLRQPAFELRRRLVAESRVQTHPVVDLLDEFRYVLLQFLQGMIGARVDFLLFQRLQKISHRPFSHGRPARLMLSTALMLSSRSTYSLLAYWGSAIGMMHQSRAGLATVDRAFQSRQRERGLQTPAQRPAH